MLRVLLVSDYPLYSEGIESLLCHTQGLAIIARESKLQGALESIARLHPDLIIAASRYPVWDPNSIVTSLLKERIAMTVIGVNLQDNVLDICRQEQRTVAGVQDLLDVIQAVGLHPER